VKITSLAAAYANASPLTRYRLEQVARIVEDVQRRWDQSEADGEAEVRPIGARDLIEEPMRPWFIRDRLTPDQLEELVAFCRGGGTIAEAARRYRISLSSVSRILRKAARLDGSQPPPVG
jgi:DNA invertase Pin-like site-specific DNA recombinase